MANNKGNKNDGLASSSSANLVNFEDTNMDVIFTEDEIHKVAMEEEGSDKVKDMLANLSMTPATNYHRRKKKYYRITQFQTKEMEGYYKSCPHPNEKQRRELAEELGLHHLQVVFWFKNKRKQMKNHRARMKNFQLRAENEKLKNLKRKGNICLCGEQGLPEDHKLRLENERLKKEYMELLLLVGNLVFINYSAPIN